MLAIDFGKLHESCPEAMVWRRSLPPTATQSDAYLACQRGDWLLWQLATLPPEQYETLRPAIKLVLEKIVDRAIRRGLASIEGVEEPWATSWRSWAAGWLSGENGSAEGAEAAKEAARAAAEAAAEGEAEGEAARAAVVAAWAAWVAAMAARATAWLAAEARSAGLVAARAARAAWVAGSAAGVDSEELRLQAEDIRREIPEWPGE